jgi:4-hydroxybenzoate polyprenyltransferase/phosphoserine phosphatase
MVPLCVDLDGTLVRTDTLHESFLRAFRREPGLLLRIPGWLLRGRAHLKRQLAARAALNADSLPYNEELLDYLRQERAAGRSLVLATAADSRIAEDVAAHVGCFDQVVGSENGDNLRGVAKRERLEAMFGRGGFDYAGDSGADLAVWEGAREAVLVGVDPGVRRRLVGKGIAIAREFARPLSRPGAILRAMRMRQWSKNLLLFVALGLSHRVGEPARVMAVLGAFLAFGYVASAVYIANDLLDLDHDRAHPLKRQRPFASGELPIGFGAVSALVLLVLGLALGFVVSPGFGCLLCGYAAIAVGYTLFLKRMPMVDVATLALLYTVRVMGGGVAADVPVSPWLLGFSIFLFFSLALVKRVSELRLLAGRLRGDLRGRGYRVGEDTLLSIMGIASGYLASLVLALYMQSPEVVRLYARPEWLWPACPLLMVWISRVWLLAHRDQMPDDPIVFALRDKASYVLGAMLCALVVIGAWGGP